MDRPFATLTVVEVGVKSENGELWSEMGMLYFALLYKGRIELISRRIERSQLQRSKTIRVLQN